MVISNFKNLLIMRLFFFVKVLFFVCIYDDGRGIERQVQEGISIWSVRPAAIWCIVITSRVYVVSLLQVFFWAGSHQEKYCYTCRNGSSFCV